MTALLSHVRLGQIPRKPAILDFCRQTRNVKRQFSEKLSKKLKLTAQEFTLHSVTQADQAKKKKKKTVTGVGYEFGQINISDMTK